MRSQARRQHLLTFCLPGPVLEAKVAVAYGSGVVLYTFVALWGTACFGDELKDLVYFNLGSEASVLIAPELACLTKAAVKAFSSARRLV